MSTSKAGRHPSHPPLSTFDILLERVELDRGWRTDFLTIHSMHLLNELSFQDLAIEIPAPSQLKGIRLSTLISGTI